MIKFYTMKEYTEISGVEESDITIDTNKSINYVLWSDNLDCGYLGIIYYDGSCAVVGCGMDRFVKFEELVGIMASED